MKKRSVGTWMAPGLMLGLAFVVGARQSPEAQEATKSAAAAEGIPVTSDEVKRVCGVCHVPDAQGKMTRISYRRATPENWELTIRRMLSLNNAPITSEQARSILKYLADNHGLAPEEAKPVMFEADRSLTDFTYTANADTHNLCNKCHSMGRVLSERRTPEEWKLLVSMHRGVYPGIDGGSGGFRSGGGGGGGAGRGGTGAGRGTRQPMDLATDHLSTAFPLMSNEWVSWAAARRPMSLAGRWTLSGYQVGLGPVYGEVTMTDVPGGADSVTTSTTFTYVKSGKTIKRTGKGLVYTGFQWRGRSAEAGEGTATWREVSFVERDQNTITGRWYTGAYDETGISVTLRRVNRDTLVTGTNVPSLKAGAIAQTVRVYGANFPPKLVTGDVGFGAGVTVKTIGAVTPTMLTVTVDVAANAAVGPRDVLVAGAARPAALVVYDKVTGIKVQPRAGLARLGGAVFPKRFEQFEAQAFSNGLDGKADTADDLMIGMVDASWSLEEYSATYKEDDLKFVGNLAKDTGLFTPNIDGPNPERSGNRNNMGDVWVVASYTPPGGSALKGRAHLLVTVPLYMNWTAQEVGK
jgi:quinohemoprotein amine dehydrogenase